MNESLITKLLILPGFIIGFALHEFAHALAADRLGDPTPRQQGRLTIEPLPHIDLIGLLFVLFAGFGWAKPVQTNPLNYKHIRRDDSIVSFAGPAANLLIALLFGFIVVYIDKSGNMLEPNRSLGILNSIFGGVVYANVLLFVFNLLPIPPLDGSHILANILPYNLREKYLTLQYYSLLIFVILAVTGVFGLILKPLIDIICSFIVTLAFLVISLFIH